MNRTTVQARILREVFVKAQRPLNAEEAYQHALKQAPRLGIATVYRTVRRLLKEGFLSSVILPGEAARYELARSDHRHHFRCRECVGVFPIEGCSGNIDQLKPSGFVLERHEIVLHGLCSECAQSEATVS